MPSDKTTVTLDTSADSATVEGETGQSNGSVSGGTTYDDSKVVERLDGILERFDSVDDALKSLSQRSVTKEQGDASSVVTIDGTQYDHLSYAGSLLLFVDLAGFLVLCCCFGWLLWRGFSTGWKF